MSDDSRRNPYLILGVPFGSSASEATRAFAKRSRSARAGSGAYSVEDLTWALHQVEHAEQNPHSTLSHFRIPADPDAAESLMPAGPAGQVLPMGRKTPKPDAEIRSDAALALLRAAVLARQGRTASIGGLP